ncbi:hypothetical protein CCUS01_14101 [Colletotrichum cuscutae]|uniref:Uncharacterized protein n=1 Tax=Colletotrichum cuscutae TaxID=1209917 RepID=A0AAI9YA05_9PEZI|nr:hypothetical protein CCUS01_14101 [Colletotrichum cuscutae]
MPIAACHNSTYGEENVKKIKAVSQKYDKEGTFQRLVPGVHLVYIADEKSLRQRLNDISFISHVNN